MPGTKHPLLQRAELYCTECKNVLTRDWWGIFHLLSGHFHSSFSSPHPSYEEKIRKEYISYFKLISFKWFKVDVPNTKQAVKPTSYAIPSALGTDLVDPPSRPRSDPYPGNEGRVSDSGHWHFWIRDWLGLSHHVAPPPWPDALNKRQ